MNRNDIKYEFYFTVNKEAKESNAVAVRVTLYDSDNGLSGRFNRDWQKAMLYGEDMQEIIDIFVEAATWAE